MTRTIEELIRIQNLWANAGDPAAGVLADALAHIHDIQVTDEMVKCAQDAYYKAQGVGYVYPCPQGIKAALKAALGQSTTRHATSPGLPTVPPVAETNGGNGDAV